MKPFNAQLDSALLARTRTLAQLTMLLRQSLPPECDGHYNVAAIRDRTLVIVTDSPVWTTRLRQLGNFILQTLTGKTRQPLQHVRIISRHGPVISDYEQPVVKRELSQQSGRQITQTASYINNEPLRKALLKIARRARKNNR